MIRILINFHQGYSLLACMVHSGHDNAAFMQGRATPQPSETCHENTDMPHLLRPFEPRVRISTVHDI